MYHGILRTLTLQSRARFVSVAASADAPIAVLITPESLSADSCAYPWSSSGGVASRGDGVGDGDGDNDSLSLSNATPSVVSGVGAESVLVDGTHA